VWRWAALLCCAATVAAGQSFDVASVKPAAPYKGGPIHIGVSGGPGTDDPGRLVFSNATLKMVLVDAYEVQNWRILGPDWLNDDMFDITAKLPEGATKQQLPAMLQALLGERFGMKAHRETRDLPSYVLTVGKGRPKLKISEAPDPPPEPRTTSPTPGITKLTCMKCPISKLIEMLGNPLDRPIYDQTRLTGNYDFMLTWQPEYRVAPGMAGPPPPGFSDTVSILTVAVQEQLGLKLELKKVPVEVVVIDRIERTPAGN
jgi:uncharacterized protein (TIGR03435 family)